MSGLGGGNGDGWPPDGGGQPDGLPGLPPEWGTIVIPDDPAHLATEATKGRRAGGRGATGGPGGDDRADGTDTEPSGGQPGQGGRAERSGLSRERDGVDHRPPAGACRSARRVAFRPRAGTVGHTGDGRAG